MDIQTMEQGILVNIQPPRIGKASAKITAYGAKAGASQPQTKAIQAAIEDVHRRGGGRVIVPSGRFCTSSLCLLSGVELYLAKANSTLCFTTQTDEDHYPLAYVHWEATPCYNYRPLLYAFQQQDISIAGPGLLDGQAASGVWWNWHSQKEQAWSADGANLQNKARMLSREMNQSGVPVEDRRFGDGHYLRPNFIQFIGCKRVSLRDFTIINSPMWLINPVCCQSVTISGLTLSSKGPNNDGVDPESCDGVLIENNYFDTGDDCISLKSGRDRDGRRLNMPCRNVLIRGNRFADGHGGITAGSEASGGISNVVARNNHFDSPHLTYALRLKTNARRGGVMENIALCDSVIARVSGAAIHGTMMYEDGANGDILPRFRNILIENLEARGGEYGIFLEAFQEAPITGLTLRNICIKGAKRPLHAAYWQDATLEKVEINGESYPRPTRSRISGIPCEGEVLQALSSGCGEPIPCVYEWFHLQNGKPCSIGHGQTLTLQGIPAGDSIFLRTTDHRGRSLDSIPYQVQAEAPDGADLAGMPYSREAARLRAIGVPLDAVYPPNALLSRRLLCRLLAPLLPKAETDVPISDVTIDDPDGNVIRQALAAGALALRDGCFQPEGSMRRDEMATVAMQSCGLLYTNASTTMPQCTDVAEISEAMGTNIARSLYFGFQALDAEGRFRPEELVTLRDGIVLFDAVANFAGF